MRAKANIRVVIGLIFNEQGQILISKRAEETHQGGKWEFPGGKVEADESDTEALVRELDEEVGIKSERYAQQMCRRYCYPEYTVELIVYRVLGYTGKPVANEQQQLRWVNISELSQFDFPAANQSILRMVSLADIYAITPEHYRNLGELKGLIELAVNKGIQLFQFRNHHLSDEDYKQQAKALAELCHRHSVRLILNHTAAMVEQCQADGLHLTARQTAELQSRPLPESYLVGASCHNQEELAKAETMQLDYAFLSPVLQTATHPESKPLGWDRFAQLCRDSCLLIYALGGLQATDLKQAQNRGAKGIAMIQGVWT